MSRLLSVLAAGLLCLFAAACWGGGDDADEDLSDRELAVVLAATLLGQDVATIEEIGSRYTCTVAFPDQPDLQPVPSSCRWDAERQGEQWLVTFRRDWLCDDFAGDHPDYPACDDASGFHEWQFLVDTERGEAQLLEESGQFPPDFVR